MNRDARIAIWVLTLIGLLAAWKLFGQGFGNFRTDQPFLARNYSATSTEPGTNLLFAWSNVMLWWVASDVPTNHVVTNQWLDRIQGAVMGQMDPALQLTNTASGIHFDGAGYLTNNQSSLSYPGNLEGSPMFLLIMSHATDGTINDIWLNDGSTAYGGLRIKNTDQMLFVNGLSAANTSDGPMPNGVLYDFLAQDMDMYTNGVMAHDGTGWNLGAGYFVTFGGEGVGVNQMNGYLREIVVWTNTDAWGPSRPLASGVISNLHYYATNRYKFAP